MTYSSLEKEPSSRASSKLNNQKMSFPINLINLTAEPTKRLKSKFKTQIKGFPLGENFEVNSVNIVSSSSKPKITS